MIYSRINLLKTNYQKLTNWQYITNINPDELDSIYRQYCRYKQFPSVMPLFHSQYYDKNNDLIGYYQNNKLVAFSLIRRHDDENVEAIQFAWIYDSPSTRLGIESLKNECAIYKERGYKFLYLGGADFYKTEIAGYETLGPL